MEQQRIRYDNSSKDPTTFYHVMYLYSFIRMVNDVFHCSLHQSMVSWCMYSWVPIIRTYRTYYTYCSNFWWIVLFIFITALLFLLYICSKKNVDRTVNFYYCTALPIIRTVLKNQACNIYNKEVQIVYNWISLIYV